MRTLAAWLESMLLQIPSYMKTECLQTKWDAAFLGRNGKDRVALIKSLLYIRVEKGAGGARYKKSKEVWSK